MRRGRFAVTLSLALLAPATALAQTPKPEPAPPFYPDPAPAPAPTPPPAPTPTPAPATTPASPDTFVPDRFDQGQPNAPLVPAAPPTSTSGTDVAPSQPPTPPLIATDPAAEAKQDARLRALEKRVERDERQIRTLEDRLKLFRHLRFEGFVQPQLLVQTYNSAASPNVQPNGSLPAGIGPNDTIAKADGTTTNGTFFRVRRARLRMFHETDVARFFLQLDAIPAGGVGPGVGTILRNAEATGIARWTRDIRTEVTAGLFFTPFRAELLEPSLTRPFIERTWFILNAFPTERDYGVHAKTIALGDRVVFDLAVVNGQRLGERTFVALPDLNRSKDYIAYATYQIGFAKIGASGYLGRGQVVDGPNLRFKQYSKWAVNYQASAAYRLLRRVGETRLSGELTVAQNMDAGVIYPYAVPQIPANIRGDVINLDERALYVRLEQDITRRFTVGYRFDSYTPNTEIKNNARDTHAWLAVWKISPNLRLMNELGWAIDNVHPLNTAPRSKHIVYSSTVLQAMF